MGMFVPSILAEVSLADHIEVTVRDAIEPVQPQPFSIAR